jgi:hypothetical protein
MPEITDYLLALGIVVSPNAADKYVTYYFEMLPEISLSAWGSSSASHIAKNVVALFTELVRRYYTPYVEEAVLLKTIKILPQPIEEAISDCAWGVIARRYKGRHGTTCYSWTSKEAWDYDAYVTYRDMYGDFPWLSPQMPRRESWEAAAIELRAEELKSE